MNFYDDINIYEQNIALIKEDGEEISFKNLLSAADEIRNVIGHRCLVFNLCENSFESIAGYIGFLRGRIVSVLLGNDVNKELLSNLLNIYKPKFIWLNKNKFPEIEKRNWQEVYKMGNYILVATSYEIDYELNDELAVLLTTSGSTGSPKLVRQSYNNINSNANSIAIYLKISAQDRPITTLPMSYTYGLSIINSHLLKGASIVLTNSTLMDKAFWESLKNNKVTTFGGVPYIYEMLKKLRFERMNLPSLKILTQAGGKLNAELASEFAEICEKKEIQFIVMYGQTEATARMSYLPSKFAKTKAGSMGIAIPGGKFWLEDNEGKVIEGNEITGELVYKGDNVSLGYAESCYDLVKNDENCNVLHTGDMAKRDGDGFYYIVGRKKRFLKMFGSRVNLDEVEGILKKQGFEVACAGEDDKLEIYTTNKNHEEIKSFIVEHIGINKSGFKVIQIEEIPRNESGKILYSAL